MRVVLFLLSAFAVLAGCGFFSIAKSAIHEIEGIMSFVVAAVLFSAAAVIDAIAQRRKDLATTEATLGDIAAKLQAQSAHLKTLADAATRRADLPPLPGCERYFLSIDGQIEGPHDLPAVLELRRKGLLATDTMLLREGSQEWKPLGSVPS